LITGKLVGPYVRHV